MSSTVDLCIAIYDQGACHEHWALYIDDGESNYKSLLTVKPSSRGRPRFTSDTRHARTLQNEAELIYVCSMHPSNANLVCAVARQIKITDLGINAWNCQEYVRDLLDILEVNNFIPVDVEYYTQKAYIRGRIARARTDYAFPPRGSTAS
ncbi:hypothetical protein BO78DRAFT_180449 [Aspergillus sclerotiicarbonarius CBS 121057]|uniref:Uncharacterized protein n=1 Tax=Aspergillus sclerotiicarbonarius (strain CBS 121057 / IBT 28362) TaxID=1448318 RepID=A0A319EZM2_ASPSB|nr:hypothetical protein BO78DRAFT_180449 [Aspergillus sclerotiicarbonarius CBS 121057]